ncbi:MAG: hypothetical protein NWE92_09280 [Candidatus Bathyarchaeota archaeon]|nr:hypothetical protein [Candidatus Bathyarchaeota archaeon]
MGKDSMEAFNLRGRIYGGNNTGVCNLLKNAAIKSSESDDFAAVVLYQFGSF